jgi:hypothetical protein
LLIAYNTGSVRHAPRQLLVGTDDGSSEHDGDELDFGVFWMEPAVADGTVRIVWERLGVSHQHFGLGDQVDRFMRC